MGGGARRRALFVVCVAGAASLTAGCGGGDDSESGASGDEAAVEAVVTEALTSTDPAKCETVFTDTYLEENFFADSPEEGLKTCQKTAADDVSPDATVEDVVVDGTTATAVKVDGADRGPEYELVKEGDTWKIEGTAIAG